MSDAHRTTRLLEAIRLAQNEFILGATSQTAFRVLLDELLSLTESSYGFIGVVEYVADVFVEEDDEEAPPLPQLRVLAYTDISWNEETRQLLRDNATTGLLFENMETLFGYAILNDQLVIANDAENDPRAGGIPEGHPPLKAFMGIPFYYGEELIGLIGLANREEGYSEEVAKFLEPLVTTCGIMAHSRRISLERKRRDDLEEGAERTQRLVQFSQRLAHDLNNLLTVTLTTMDTILLTDTAERSDLVKVHAATKQAAQLTKKIMSFAESTAINRSTVSVDEVIRDAVSICKSIFPSHIQLITETVDSIPDILADPPALKQAIINMVLNSIEAIGTESGVVWIRGDKRDDGKVVIEVSDDGPGMDEATKERAFDPYFSTRSEDRGFGLTSVHDFAKSHNATLELSSKQDVGTSIRITLANLSAETQPTQPNTDFEFAGKRILIVDDDTVILSAVSKLLKRLGVDVLTAESGEAALAVLGRVSGIDLVLLDVSMPAVDGVETSRRIRAKAHGLPIVFMSGQTKRAVPPEISIDDNSTFLSKPFTMATLREAFENVFNRMVH